VLWYAIRSGRVFDWGSAEDQTNAAAGAMMPSLRTSSPPTDAAEAGSHPKPPAPTFCFPRESLIALRAPVAAAIESAERLFRLTGWLISIGAARWRRDEASARGRR